MKFTKWQGTGNDFVIVTAVPEELAGEAGLAELARRTCDRHFGIGADGLILIWKGPQGMLQMRIFNSDGSEAEMCGNGLRCVAKLAYQSGLTNERSFPVQTGAGVLVPEMIIEEDRVVAVRVDMGEPVLQRELIPVTGEPGSRVLDQVLEVDGESYQITAVSMGNPHCLIFVSDVASAPVHTLGSKLETHPIFPRRSNIEFVAVKSPTEIDLRVWERGVGETLACGTASCATVVGGALTGRYGRRVQVNLPGGTQLVEWAENNHVFLTGSAEEVFQGVWLE